MGWVAGTMTVAGLVAARLVLNRLQPKCKPRYGVHNKTIIVTGGNSGIGYELVKYLYKEGANVILACRSEEKAKQAIEKIEKQCSGGENLGQMTFIRLDLNSFESIREFADEIRSRDLKVFTLINNAGVFGVPFNLNADGFEEHFMVNHLAPQLLTDLLLPNLVNAGTEISPSKIIYVSSILYKHGQIEDVFFKPCATTLEDFNKSNMYSNSKLAALLYARELADQVSKAKYPLYVNIASPGMVATNLSRHDKYRWLKAVLYAPVLLLFLRTPRQGSQTILECVMANNLSSNGKFYRQCKPAEFTGKANDFGLIDKVYNLTRQAIGK